MKTITLVAIAHLGTPRDAIADMPELVRQNCTATAAFYQSVGFEPPWIGYVSIADAVPIGGGAFKGPPRNGRAEIAYYTLPSVDTQNRPMVDG